MKIIDGRLFIVFIMVLALILGACPISIGSGVERSGSGTGEKAYIFIGDVNPTWYSLLLRSIFGEVDPDKELQPVIEAQKKKLEAMGYTVTIKPIAIESDLKSALQDPATKAVAWFGHGDAGVPGTIYTAQLDEIITPEDIAEWAREQLAKEVGKPDTWENLPGPERAQLWQRWINAHFNLKYAYFHTCYGLKGNTLVDVLMDDDGKFYGYKDTSWLSDTSTMAPIIRGKPVGNQSCSWSGTWNTDWGEQVMHQSGDNVSGTYTHDQGRIVGNVSGNKLKGTWSEAPSYSPTRDAGDVELTLFNDCKSFSGNWRYGSGGGWSGGWTGTRA